jgi:hypothetical protein
LCFPSKDQGAARSRAASAARSFFFSKKKGSMDA